MEKSELKNINNKNLVLLMGEKEKEWNLLKTYIVTLLDKLDLVENEYNNIKDEIIKRNSNT